MIATKLTAEPLTEEVVTELVRAEGPCITLLLPPYRPGELAEPPAAILKMQLQEAGKKLAARRISAPAIARLLEPLERLLHEEEWQSGSGLARVIFRAHDVCREVELPVPPSPAEACIAGECFYIRPILPSLAWPEQVYVLQVTKKAVALLACGATQVTHVNLPGGTPTTLDEALGFDPPDHDLMNRTAAGPSTGSMQGVQFGTGSGRETQHTYVHDFYRAVDRGVNELLRANHSPLVLAGVEEDVAIYRSISTYANLLAQGIHGSPNAAASSTQLLRQAHDIALFSCQRRRALEMAAAKERLSPGRFSSQLDVILRAAVEGRVSDLYLDENGRQMGTFDGRVFGGRTNWHDEDMLNVAALETLLRSGAVCSMPTHLMPAGALAVASFRY